MDTKLKCFKSSICLSKIIKTGNYKSSPKKIQKPYSPDIFNEENDGDGDFKNRGNSDSEEDDFEVFEVQDSRFKLSSNEFVKG